MHRDGLTTIELLARVSEDLGTIHSILDGMDKELARHGLRPPYLIQHDVYLLLAYITGKWAGLNVKKARLSQ